MALIHREQHNGTVYEVRSAGKTRRLYANGVFHSQWHPDRLLTGSLWDLLLIPVFLLNRPESLRDSAGFLREYVIDALVLGVGGGTVINQIQTAFSQASVVGVDLDAAHLALAHRFFGLRHENLRLVRAEAAQWVSEARQTGRQFNYIVDDLFCENPSAAGEAKRAIDCNASWMSDLMGLLRKGGLLVVNFESEAQFHTACRVLRGRGIVADAFCIARQGYYNAIGIFSKTTVTKGGHKQILLKQLSESGIIPAGYATKVQDFSLKRSRIRFE